MDLLLTAFEPFGGEAVNAALEAVCLVPELVGGVRVRKLEVPTAFCKSVRVVCDAIDRFRPDAVLCVGQAAGRKDVTPERVAINLDDAIIPDNEGSRPVDAPIFPDGENAYFSTLPIKGMVKEIQAAGLPASVSNSAGTYVCNHLMYGVLYHLSKNHPGTRGGFLHVPQTPAQAAGKGEMPSMELTDTVRALTAAICAIGAHIKDIPVTGGRIY